jgi:hypothetical protein
MNLKALAASIIEQRIQRDSTRDTCRDSARESVPSTSNERDAVGQPERIIEATFTTAPTPAYSAAEFPPCPVCGSVRYWLAFGGRVLCGTKECKSAQRFQLIALEFRHVN